MRLLCKRAVVLAALSVVGLLALSLGRTAPVAEAASCSTSGWNVAKTLPTGSSLYKVSAVAGNAWAVGGGPKGPLIMRFDGTRWTEVPVPGADALLDMHPELQEIRGVRLEGVFARTATDAWAVGHAGGVTPGVESLQIPVALRWDGTAWRYVPIAGPPLSEGDTATLRDVVALGPNDAWAVGSYTLTDLGTLPLAMHWDGQRWTHEGGVWSMLTDPWESGGALYAAARNPYAQTLWTVGYEDPPTGGWRRGLIARYGSDAWTQVLGGVGATLRDVTAIAWNDAWAVGHRQDDTGPTTDLPPVALHRDASRWSPVPTAGAGVLTAVSAVSSDDVWAIGSGDVSYDYRGGYTDSGEALMQHWDGTSWATVTPPAGVTSLSDIAMRPPSGWGWAVGATATRGVILRHCP